MVSISRGEYIDGVANYVLKTSSGHEHAVPVFDCLFGWFYSGNFPEQLSTTYGTNANYVSDYDTIVVTDKFFNKTYTIAHCGYKFKIHPNKAQENAISKAFGCARTVYNRLVEKYIEHVDSGDCNYPTNYNSVINRATEPWWNEVSSNILDQAALHFRASIKNMFDGSSKPKFKSKKSKQSFSCVATGEHCLLEINDKKSGRIKIPKIGWLKISKHRIKLLKQLDYRWKWSHSKNYLKTITVSKGVGNSYYCSIQSVTIREHLPVTGRSVGIDLGISKYATKWQYSHDDGKFQYTSESVDNPSFFDKELKRLEKLQQQFAKTQKGSNRHEKLRLRIAKLHLKVANKRKDFQHKLSTQLVRDNQVIIIEDLNITGMLTQHKSNHTLHRHIQDCAWYEFRRMLEYKCKWYGRILVAVNPKDTTQVCSCCKQRFYKEPRRVMLWDRELFCTTLGCNMFGIPVDRDLNAAKNIFDKGNAFLREFNGIT